MVSCYISCSPHFFWIDRLIKISRFLIYRCSFIFLFMALRYGYGNDYFNYSELHAFFHDYGIGEFDFEYLYKYINLISTNFQFVILVQSLLFITAFFLLTKALRRLGCNPSLVALLFFLNPYLFLIHLTAIRQSMAICIFVIFISLFLIHRRYLFIVLAVALPMLFHEASILYLSVIPILVFVERIYSAKWHHKIFYSALALYLLSSVFAIGLPDTFIKYDVYVGEKFGKFNKLINIDVLCFGQFFFFLHQNLTWFLIQIQGKYIKL